MLCTRSKTVVVCSRSRCRGSPSSFILGRPVSVNGPIKYPELAKEGCIGASNATDTPCRSQVDSCRLARPSCKSPCLATGVLPYSLKRRRSLNLNETPACAGSSRFTVTTGLARAQQ